MDPSSSRASKHDAESIALETLLEAFGSACSLEEIASAYCEAKGDMSKAGDILLQLQAKNSNDVFHAQNGEMNISQSVELLHKDNVESSAFTRKNSKGAKPRKFSASMGTVSSFLGKSYARPASAFLESSAKSKPLKIEVKGSAEDEHDMERVESHFVPKKELSTDTDIEEFLFSMLGDGFKLNMDMIREVLGQCGYNIKKSMEELLALSAKNLDKNNSVDNNVVRESTGGCSKWETSLSEENYLKSSTQSNIIESSCLDKKRSSLSREVLQSLFNAPERLEEPKPKRLEWGSNRTRVVGQKPVTKPLEDLSLSTKIEDPKVKLDNKDDEEDDYQFLRRATKQHWDAMKQYYEAAVDAFTKGDRKKANYLLEEGKHYNQKAREADEKSAVEILDTRKSGIQGKVIILDLHDHHPKEALDLLKLHLRSLANIPSFRHLKVIVGTNAADITKGKRKRMVVKLLEKESIKWTEEEGKPGTYLIQLDLIDPNKLSFVKVSE
ncbi:putative nuclear RNA export factor SDE5 isoform X2 [Phoenix dactylifera]|uniref:Nuclear RNA export factor SDE5 isoform X2 n=1 Tax=Phoenix dactylifera TaxID=42345 RepID=A0A8B8ZZD5_PHODC|nr:putative nuclear RNA export factor SDE5 isoform X2 [Phoenix dactylifera]